MIARGSAQLLGATLAILAAPAFAQSTAAHCTVRIIHALENAEPAAQGASAAAPAEGSGHSHVAKIDPKIVRLRPYLSKPPFTSWHEFVFLEEKALELAPKVAQTFTLPNGKPASLTYVEHLPAPAGKHRVRLQLQIGEPAKPALNTVFVVDEGGVVLQAGQHFKKGLLVLGTSCEEAHAR
jgi:hypothetical protein